MAPTIRHEESGPYVTRTVIEWPHLTTTSEVEERSEAIERVAHGDELRLESENADLTDERDWLADERGRLQAALQAVRALSESISGKPSSLTKAQIADKLLDLSSVGD